VIDKSYVFNFSSFICFGQNDHFQKDIINTYENYHYHVTDTDLSNTTMYIDLLKYLKIITISLFTM
jgi:hypothetical protein